MLWGTPPENRKQKSQQVVTAAALSSLHLNKKRLHGDISLFRDPLSPEERLFLSEVCEDAISRVKNCPFFMLC